MHIDPVAVNQPLKTLKDHNHFFFFTYQQKLQQLLIGRVPSSTPDSRWHRVNGLIYVIVVVVIVLSSVPGSAALLLSNPMQGEQQGPQRRLHGVVPSHPAAAAAAASRTSPGLCRGLLLARPLSFFFLANQTLSCYWSQPSELQLIVVWSQGIVAS